MNTNNSLSRANLVTPEFIKLLPAFKRQFFGDLPPYIQKQYMDSTKIMKYGYFYASGSRIRNGREPKQFPPLDDAWLVDHFYVSKGREDGNTYYGALAIRPPLTAKGRLLWVSLDLDSEDEVKKFDSGLRKELTKLNIDFLEELGGLNEDRRHIWIRVDAEPAETKQFFSYLITNVYDFEDPITAMSSTGFQEFFGVNKLNNIIRIPLGFHLKRDLRSPILTKEGIKTVDPEEFFKEWDSLKVLDSAQMANIFSTFKITPQTPTPVRTLKKDRFYYQSLNLSRDMDVPPELLPVYKNCQAIHGVLEDVVNDKMIQLPGETHHSAGLYLAGIAAYSDAIGKKSSTGEKWFRKLVEDYRTRDDSAHNWLENYDKAQSNPGRYFPACTTWEEKFDKCRGCPFKERISSPTAFIYGEEVKPTKVHDVNLVTAQQIRQTTFKQVEAYIDNLMLLQKEGNILLASPMGAGKSVLIDQLACKYAKQGKKILIASPTIKVSKEHKDRIETCGEHAFMLVSHSGAFKEQLMPFSCPSSDEIQEALDLGVQTSIVKNAFCQSCPFRDQCYYPNQYAEVMEDKHKIVLIQHAHMGNAEVLHKLLSKQFDILFVDETFINTVYKEIPIRPVETNLLDSIGFEWTDRLVNWLNGARPFGNINPLEMDLKQAQGVIQSAKIEWRLPELIRLYNQKRLVDTDTQTIQVIYELPDISIKVFTDATPPEELIKEVTGIQTLDVFGRGEILDIKAIHPDNKIYQILNNSTSVTSLEDKDKFEAILYKIGELVELKYTAGEKILLTCYKNDIERIVEFFELHKEEFPNFLNRVTLDWMSKGTNKYEDYDIQFLFCGVYMTGGDVLKEVGKYREVANYYRGKLGLDLLDITDKPDQKLIRLAWEAIPVSRYEYKSQGQGEYIQYPSFKTRHLSVDWERYIYNLCIATTQQSIRLRFKPDKPREVYILNNLEYPSLCITDSILIEDFILPL